MGNAVIETVARFYSWRNLPPLQGSLSLPTDISSRFLRGPVRIVRDCNGTPHIYAQGKSDLILGQGFVTAQDRLFSLELLRRIGAGTLAEIKPDALFVDRLSRTLGFLRCAQVDEGRMDTESLECVDAFCAGVNAFLDSPEFFRRPVEAFFSGIEITPFRRVDILSILRVYAWDMSRNWLGKISQIAIQRSLLGEEAAQRTDSTIATDLSFASVLSDVHERYPCTFDGSNSFVVSGNHTTTGLPMLCSDPHLAVKNPSQWLTFHLVCPSLSLDALGFTIVGCWGIQIGRTECISFGATVAFSDIFDIYIEKEDPNRANWFEFNGEMYQGGVREEIIHVKGQDEPIIHQVRSSRHGPILSDVVDFQETEEEEEEEGEGDYNTLRQFSCRGTCFTNFRNPKITSLCDLMWCRTWTDFLLTIHSAREIAITFTYADIQNNIGVAMSGAVPVRSRKAIRLANCPMPGWEREYQWRSFQRQVPAALNPARGYVVAANHDVFGNRPFFISKVYYSGLRARRIAEMLEEAMLYDNKLDVDDMERILHDTKQFDVSWVAEYAQLLLDWPWVPRLLKSAARELAEFSGDFTVESVGASLYSAFEPQLVKVLAQEEGATDNGVLRAMGMAISKKFKGKSEYMHLRKRVTRHLFRKHSLPKRRLIVLTALQLAVTTLRKLIPESHGLKDPEEILSTLQFGRVHTIKWAHRLDKYAPGLSIGPFPIPGGQETVNVATMEPLGEDFSTKSYPNGRFIADLSDIHATRAVLYPGQCSNVSSPWYQDGAELFVQKKLRPMYSSDGDVNENRVAEMVICGEEDESLVQVTRPRGVLSGVVMRENLD